MLFIVVPRYTLVRRKAYTHPLFESQPQNGKKWNYHLYSNQGCYILHTITLYIQTMHTIHHLYSITPYTQTINTMPIHNSPFTKLSYHTGNPIISTIHVLAFIVGIILSNITGCIVLSISVEFHSVPLMCRRNNSRTYLFPLLIKYYVLHFSMTSLKIPNKGNNKITELRTILQRESQNS